jgi:hypothetical protein
MQGLSFVLQKKELERNRKNNEKDGRWKVKKIGRVINRE